MGYQHQPFDMDLPSADRLWHLTAPLRFYFAPTFYGIDKIDPEHPVLLVGNHTIYGVLDVPLLIAQIYREQGVLVRSLADHAHYDVPVWRRMLDMTGAVEGTRDNCRRLMANGEHILVFPGGAREVSKRKGEQYQLTWKQRLGFCKLAIENGYNIVPFASVGPDDMFDILIDADDVLSTPLGTAMKKVGLLKKEGPLRGGDLIMPVVRGLGLTAIPRPEKFYFAIGDEIDVSGYAGKTDDKQALMQLRKSVALGIHDLIDELKVIRDQDKDVGLVRRLLKNA
ncbi:MAG: lysophospholipid acyltransferase family protein [Ketobacteraceae bacterium]|nr:lysophospholipid acyltransferase family protein [Ketobacteraceae bacterium]